MIDKLKKEALKHGMKLMTNPKVMKLMADPRVMNAISQGFALRGRIQSELDERLKGLACTLNLATKEDLDNLRQSVSRVESNLSNLERKVD
jgi:hypothetical protein